ncbi:MAG TPA: FtsH protease activity modulator HflK, partial [Marinobacter sp.]|nr:FtsH protease activity modulator HflK [Marinobacter sp.]
MIQSVDSNGRGRQGPPDLTELFTKLGSGGAPKGVIGIAILVLVIWGAFSAFYTVQPEERAVV